MPKAIATQDLKNFFKKGEIVFKENTKGDCMYVIKSGKVEVVKKIEGEETILATLRPKSFFGEMALFGDPYRSATIRAAEDTEMIVITKPMLDSQLENVPEWFVSMLKNLISRLREVNKSLKSRFIYGIDFTLLKSIYLMIKKYGEESDRGPEMLIDDVVKNIQSIMAISKSDIEEKLKQYNFVNLVKINPREKKIFVPDWERLNKFIAFLRGEGSEGKDSSQEYRIIKSDENLYGYFQKIYKLLNRQKLLKK